MAGTTRRRALTKGLILGGLAGLVGRAFGQTAPAEPSGPEQPAPQTPPPGPGIRVGTLNLAKVFDEVDRIKALTDEFKKDAASRRKDLVKIADKLREEIEHKNSLPPGSEARGQSEARIAQLQKEMQTAREKALKDFAHRQSELMATSYKEIQEAVGAIAKRRGLTLVLKVNDPAKVTEQQNAVQAMLDQAVVYADPALEITRDVIGRLNRGG